MGSGTAVTGELTTDATGQSGGAAPPYLLLSAPNAPKRVDEWMVQLYVTSRGGADYENFAGVYPAAMAAPSYGEPPILPGGIGLSFLSAADRYSQLLKPSTEDATWEVEVQSARSGPVTVAASNVSAVPDRLPVMLRDEQTGNVTDLRVGSYTYVSSENETRRFTFSASGLSPGYRVLGKTVYPAACLLQKWMGPVEGLEFFRFVRDRLLTSAFGRRVVLAYYRLFS